MKAYTLKMRGGVSIDSYGKRAGKGALIQEELSATLGASNDQYLFQPTGFNQLSQSAVYKEDDKTVTLSVCGGSYGGGSEMLIVEKEEDVTVFENHGTDSRYSGPLEKMPTITQYYGTGGNNQRLVVTGVDCYNLTTTGDKGRTLATASGGLNEHIPCVIHDVAWGFQRQPCNNSAEAKTVDTSTQNPSKNQGGIAVVQTSDSFALNKSVLCMATGQAHAEITENISPTLTTVAEKPIVIMDRAAYNQGKNARYNFYAEIGEVMPTVIAKGPGAVCCPTEEEQVEKCWWDGSDKASALTTRTVDQRMPDKAQFGGVIIKMTDYIVRRLTPLECNRLQGFPDGWGEIDHKDDFTDEEYKFWLEVRNTHAKINGKQVKEYTKAQMLTWYNKLHTDSAEYKMWGNGIGLPNALYVMQGIVDAEKENKRKAEENLPF